jgi:acyl-CoA synthetase (AMP-forming)/AMP-acid ligase II
MSLVIDALDAPAADRAHVHCLSDASGPITLAELGSRARRAGAWLEQVAGRAGTVATLLTPTHDCLAVFFGALRGGHTLVSLPHPSRGTKGPEYLRQIGEMCARAGATHLLCDASLVTLLGSGPLPVCSYNECSSSPVATRRETEGHFVQFTSGSTGEPKGIVLSLDAVDANLRSMYDWLEPTEGAVVCSWLPLSHDMGLIGLALYAICSVNPPWSTPSDLVLMTPESFLADPSSWLRALTEYRATSTTAPPFALRVASRALRAGSYDLSSLRSFVVGSEPVPADTLRTFEATARAFGLSATALCPGYGMAEATLAVAIHPITRAWTSKRVDADALARREWKETDNGGVEIVSCGPPVLNTEVRTAGGVAVAELEIRSPSLLSGYVGSDTAALSPDGWLHTADLSSVQGGEVFVAGRTDDVLIVAGRNLDARALDATAAAHPVCRPGNAACFADGFGRYVVVAEPSSASMELTELRRGAREIRIALAERFGSTPSAVIFIERGTLPKTPSGKVRRNHLHLLWVDGKLAEVASG